MHHEQIIAKAAVGSMLKRNCSCKGRRCKIGEYKTPVIIFIRFIHTLQRKMIKFIELCTVYFHRNRKDKNKLHFFRK
jgi:hypothetical protein